MPYIFHPERRTEVDEFTAAYIECALWSSTDNADDSGGSPLDENYGPEDLDLSTLDGMIKDCADFQESEAADLAAYRQDAGQAGHDFWLTRNRHGAGFWDRGLGDVGNRLTDAAHAYGSVDLYVGDDGRIYST